MPRMTCPPEIETIGFNMLSLINNIQTKEIQPFLEKHNLTEIEPDKWYPASRLVNILDDINEDPGGMFNLVAIGMAIAENVPLPPEIQTLEAILAGWNDVYHMQHRGGDIGYVAFEKKSEKHFITIHNHLYSDDFNYGLAYGFTRRLVPSGTHFTVKYDENEPRLDEGGERTVIHIILD